MSANCDSRTPEELKEVGNQHFKDGEYLEAVKMYSIALSRSDKKPEKATLYKNRSACYLKLVRS